MSVCTSHGYSRYTAVYTVVYGPYARPVYTAAHSQWQIHHPGGSLRSGEVNEPPPTFPNPAAFKLLLLLLLRKHLRAITGQPGNGIVCRV